VHVLIIRVRGKLTLVDKTPEPLQFSHKNEALIRREQTSCL
jgi:hypothetical protein